MYSDSSFRRIKYDPYAKRWQEVFNARVYAALNCIPMQARLQGKKFKMQSMAQNWIKTKSIRKLSNFNFQWTKTLYQDNFKHSAFLFTLFMSFKCYKLYTIQYKFYCQLPMGAFQRQILIVQVIKKQTNKKILKNCQ